MLDVAEYNYVAPGMAKKQIALLRQGWQRRIPPCDKLGNSYSPMGVCAKVGGVGPLTAVHGTPNPGSSGNYALTRFAFE